MLKKALLVIDIQGITKNCKEIIENINSSIDWAVSHNIHVIYIRHEKFSARTKTFTPDTCGVELVPGFKMVSNNVFTKSKANALTSEDFAAFINKNEINDFYITGADAVACVKSTCYNLAKIGYTVTVISDCIISYDKKKFPEMSEYYKNYYNNKGCKIMSLIDIMSSN